MNQDQKTRGAREELERERLDTQVAWIAWALQFVVGFVLGLGVGFEMWRMLYRGNLLELLLLFPSGGLLCGAFTSYYGNRAWMARSIFMPEETPPPQQARACSVFLGGVGAILALLALVHHVTTADDRASSLSASGFSVLPLLFAVITGYVFVHLLRSGRGLWKFSIIDSVQTPLLYWVYVLLTGVATFGLIFMAL